MSRKFTFRNFVKGLGMRLTAAAVVFGIFFGLGYVKRTNFLGLASILESQPAFFISAFLLIALIGLFWILYQQLKT